MATNDPLTKAEVLDLVQQNLCPRCAGEVVTTFPPKEAEDNKTLYACASCGWTEQNTAQKLHDA